MREIKIVKVKELTSKNGQKFTVFKALQNDGNLMDCKFTKDVTNRPTEPCIICVEEDAANVSARGLYPVLWIKAIAEIKPFDHSNNLDAYFS